MMDSVPFLIFYLPLLQLQPIATTYCSPTSACTRMENLSSQELEKMADTVKMWMTRIEWMMDFIKSEKDGHSD